MRTLVDEVGWQRDREFWDAKAGIYQKKKKIKVQAKEWNVPAGTRKGAYGTRERVENGQLVAEPVKLTTRGLVWRRRVRRKRERRTEFGKAAC